jgi:hypothetical protein
VTDTAQAVSSEAAVEGFAEKVLGDYAGANAFFMAGLGDRLGLFVALASNEPQSIAELADRTGLQERYLREWLAGMTAAGYLSYDPPSGRYTMPDAHVPVLAEEAGVLFFGAAFFDFSTNYGETFHQLLEALRSGGGVAHKRMARRWPHPSTGSRRPGSSTDWFPNGYRPCRTSKPCSRRAPPSAMSAAAGAVP